MTQNTKKTLIYGGAIVVGAVIAYAIYSANKNKLPLVDNARVTDDEETPIPEIKKANYFTSLLNNPLPSSIDYKFGGFKFD